MLILYLGQFVISLLVFGAVSLLVYAIFSGPKVVEPPLHRRVAQAVGITRQTVFENPALAPVMNMGLQLAQTVRWPSLRANVRQHLMASGNPSGYGVNEYLALCVVLGLMAGLGVLMLELFMGSTAILLVGPVLIFLGFAAPILALRGEGKRRTNRIAKQLPYTLDLISLTMSSGSTFTEAVAALIRDQPDDDFNVELAIVLSEIDYGSTRAAALSNMADRIPLDSLRSIVGAVNQAESLGTPLSNILKLQADMLRNARSVRAEKLSASASLRILLPSMLILMAAMLAILGPFALAYMQGGGLRGR